MHVLPETQITQQHSKVYDLIYVGKNVGTTNVIWYRQTFYDLLKCRITNMTSELWQNAVCRAVTIVSQELTASFLLY